MNKALTKKVLLIGWDAAEWKVINPLIEKGLMPALAGMINRGVIGNIATLDPPLSPMLWTSIATGKTADKHGILGFIEPIPGQLSLRPVSCTSRKVKAIWNILTQHNLKTHTIGWWPSHPAEPINGICISNMYAKPKGNFNQPWPMVPGTVHPKEMEELFAGFRVHPEEITAAHILPFVPLAEKVDQETDKGLQMIAKLLAESASIQAAATWILEQEQWDFLGVYFNALDHMSHLFMKFHPPRMEGLPEDVYEIYKGVMESTYVFYDMMLERQIQLAGPDATIILVSDHGFHSDHLRWKKLPDDPVSPALEHSPFGVLCMCGPGIKKDDRVYGASLLDITPTLLTLFGLPCGKDMDGKVLTSALDTDVPLTTIESWENVNGECGMHPAEMQEDPWNSQEAMQQLVELGYIEAPAADMEKTLKKIIQESRFYLAKVFISKHNNAEALPLLEKLFEESPEILRYALALALCYQAMGKTMACRKIVDHIKKNNSTPPPYIHFLEGILLAAENNPFKALEQFRKIETTHPNHVDLLIHRGNIHLKLRQWKEAASVFTNAIAIHPESANAHHGLALAFLRMGKIWESVDEALTAVGLMHFFPSAHYHLGEALFNGGEYETSAKAFEMCITQSPGNKKAHQWLTKIYSEMLMQPAKAEFHSGFTEQNIAGSINIVSGLSRSGTSMIVNMLKNAGLDILSDGIRKPDVHNPGGYFEYEKVKLLQADTSWLDEAKNKTLKVLVPNLFHLPSIYTYKIIFMLRDMEEIVLSHQTMIREKKNTYNPTLLNGFTQQLEQAKTWIESQPNVEVLYLNYKDVVNNPVENLHSISAFLEMDLDLEKMGAVIKGKYYRCRV